MGAQAQHECQQLTPAAHLRTAWLLTVRILHLAAFSTGAIPSCLLPQWPAVEAPPLSHTILTRTTRERTHL